MAATSMTIIKPGSEVYIPCMIKSAKAKTDDGGNISIVYTLNAIHGYEINGVSLREMIIAEDLLSSINTELLIEELKSRGAIKSLDV